MGYFRAGFEIVGVDIRPQPRYPFAFVQGDALEYLAAHGREFDAIHASPPCQAHSALSTMWNAKKHQSLIQATRAALEAVGRPFVIENVPGAPLRDPILLCGSHFKLRTADGTRLRRHRLFETPPYVRRRLWSCRHQKGERTIGVYGGGHGVSLHRYQHGERSFTAAEQREAMGIDWMTVDELSQAIPPAYTEHIGRQLLTKL
jgi:DNA (cytosine-5)-methyltransferase 1